MNEQIQATAKLIAAASPDLADAVTVESLRGAREAIRTVRGHEEGLAAAQGEAMRNALSGYHDQLINSIDLLIAYYTPPRNENG